MAAAYKLRTRPAGRNLATALTGMEPTKQSRNLVTGTDTPNTDANNSKLTILSIHTNPHQSSPILKTPRKTPQILKTPHKSPQILETPHNLSQNLTTLQISSQSLTKPQKASEGLTSPCNPRNPLGTPSSRVYAPIAREGNTRSKPTLATSTSGITGGVSSHASSNLGRQEQSVACCGFVCLLRLQLLAAASIARCGFLCLFVSGSPVLRHGSLGALCTRCCCSSCCCCCWICFRQSLRLICEFVAFQKKQDYAGVRLQIRCRSSFTLQSSCSQVVKDFKKKKSLGRTPS